MFVVYYFYFFGNTLVNVTLTSVSSRKRDATRI
jgi:hypothetical protein